MMPHHKISSAVWESLPPNVPCVKCIIFGRYFPSRKTINAETFSNYLAPLPQDVVPKDVSHACANPNNNIVVEPIDDEDGSNDVEVTQAEVLYDDKDDSADNRKMPACKNNNDDEDDSDDNRKMPADQNSNNGNDHDVNARDDDEEALYYNAEEDAFETAPPQCARGGIQMHSSLFLEMMTITTMKRRTIFQWMITPLCIIPLLLVVPSNQTTPV